MFVSLSLEPYRKEEKRRRKGKEEKKKQFLIFFNWLLIFLFCLSSYYRVVLLFYFGLKLSKTITRLGLYLVYQGAGEWTVLQCALLYVEYSVISDVVGRSIRKYISYKEIPSFIRKVLGRIFCWEGNRLQQVASVLPTYQQPCLFSHAEQRDSCPLLFASWWQ